MKTFKLRHVVASIGDDPSAVALSPDGKRMVVHTDKGVHIVDVAHPSRVITVKAHAAGQVVSPDGRYVYAYSAVTN